MIQSKRAVLHRGARHGKTVCICLAAAIVAGCGGTGQDDGRVSIDRQQFSGSAIDGYLARAMVFMDSNNNGTRDAWEARAFTDNDGYFSYNPLTDTDYCSPLASEQQQQYCLETAVDYSEVVIRVDGGYDVQTGEPFLGQMTRRVELDSDINAVDNLISPITTLFTSAQGQEEVAELLTSLGLTEADLDVDYLNTDGSGAVDARLLNTALTIHKAVTVLSDRLNDTYTEIGENFGTPNDASSAVYPALAEAVRDAGLDAALEPGALHAVLDQAEAQLRSLYIQKEFNLPEDMGTAEQPGQFSRIAEIVSDIPAVVDALIDVESPAPSVDEVAGQTRALESLVIKAVNEKVQIDPSIASAVEFFTTDSNEPLIGALVESLSAETADLGSLANNDFRGDDFDSVLEIARSSSIAAGAEPFTDIAGHTLRLSDLDTGTAPNKLDDSEIEFYFDGVTGDLEGSFTACVKIINDASSDGSLGEGSTRGDVATGFWSMLGSTDTQSGTFSLLLTINFLGTTYSGVIKPAGLETIDGINYEAIRFDNDGKLEKWHSLLGFMAGTNAPVTSEGCEARLPSRVGL